MLFPLAIAVIMMAYVIAMVMLADPAIDDERRDTCEDIADTIPEYRRCLRPEVDRDDDR
jgi:hypothetical protein